MSFSASGTLIGICSSVLILGWVCSIATRGWPTWLISSITSPFFSSFCTASGLLFESISELIGFELSSAISSAGSFWSLEIPRLGLLSLCDSSLFWFGFYWYTIWVTSSEDWLIWLSFYSLLWEFSLFSTSSFYVTFFWYNFWLGVKEALPFSFSSALSRLSFLIAYSSCVWDFARFKRLYLYSSTLWTL